MSIIYTKYILNVINILSQENIKVCLWSQNKNALNVWSVF